MAAAGEHCLNEREDGDVPQFRRQLSTLIKEKPASYRFASNNAIGDEIFQMLPPRTLYVFHAKSKIPQILIIHDDNSVGADSVIREDEVFRSAFLGGSIAR